VLEQRQLAREDTKPGRERYARYLKCLITCDAQNDETWKKTFEHRLELVPLANPATIQPGKTLKVRVLFEGKPLPFSARARNPDIRRQIQYIFQNPQRALNPKHTVSYTLSAALRHFFSLAPGEVERRLRSALERVALGPEVAAAYPSELSGGERQRVAIARALVCEPRLLVSDEITSSLDASVQATILGLLRQLKQDGLAILLVTHDLCVVRAVADHIVVMRDGRTQEIGSADDVLLRPRAPYTRQLIESSPTLA
jgi:peptide/nickel transport system ATP-binding protein